MKIFVVDRVSFSLLYLEVHKYWSFFLKDAADFGLEYLEVTELIASRVSRRLGDVGAGINKRPPWWA